MRSTFEPGPLGLVEVAADGVANLRVQPREIIGFPQDPTSSGLTHSVQATLNVGPPILLNGFFETGNLAGWSTGNDGGSEVLVQDNGNHIAWVGSVYGDSLLYQTFAVPVTGSTRVEATVYPICGDPVNDLQSVVVFDDNANILESLLFGWSDARTWTKLGADL